MTVLDCILIIGIAVGLVFAVRSVLRDFLRGKCCGCCEDCKFCSGDKKKRD